MSEFIISWFHYVKVVQRRRFGSWLKWTTILTPPVYLSTIWFYLPTSLEIKVWRRSHCWDWLAKRSVRKHKCHIKTRYPRLISTSGPKERVCKFKCLKGTHVSSSHRVNERIRDLNSTTQQLATKCRLKPWTQPYQRGLQSRPQPPRRRLHLY